MKKLMIAASAAFCAAVGLADVTSANVVGYNTLVTDGASPYPTIGLSFVPVGGGSAKLGDFKPADGTMNLDGDFIQVIDANTLDAIEMYQYCDPTTARAIAGDFGMTEKEAEEKLVGWWDALQGVGVDGSKSDSRPVNVGEGFLGFFFGGMPISLVSAGEAPTETTSVTTDGVSPYPIIANYIPKTIKLGMIVPKDGTMNLDGDFIQIIDPNSLDAIEMYQYCDPTTARAIAGDFGMTEKEAEEKLVGWWDALQGVGVPGSFSNNKEIAVGGGFWGFFFGGNPIEFQFPSSLDEVPDYVDPISE